MAGTGMVVEIPPIKVEEVTFKLVGDSEIITHRFSDEQKEAIKRKQMGKAPEGKKPRDPVAEYKAAMYTIESLKGKYFIPVMALKNCAVRACSFIDGMQMTKAKGLFHVMPERQGYVELRDAKPYMREDIVNLGGKGPKIPCWRPGFPDWWCKVRVRYNSSGITAEQIMNIFHNAGFSTGLGDWRPEKSGPFGMFHVEGLAPEKRGGRRARS